MDSKKMTALVSTKFVFTLTMSIFFILVMGRVSAQTVLFDFDNAPLYSSLPIDQSAGGITAHLAATTPGYSIQNANVLGFTPAGFAGHIIYPNSINQVDLFISFSVPVNAFSIMYSPQELGCDNSATMRVTAYMNGNYVGTNTRTATVPGTWPVDTLSCSFPQGFDSVVVHYDSPPPTCQDYGVIFMADNMYVTVFNSAIAEPQLHMEGFVTNPVSQSATISFFLFESQNISIDLYDVNGRFVQNLFNEYSYAGAHQVNWNTNSLNTGIYFLKLTGQKFFRTCKFVTAR